MRKWIFSRSEGGYGDRYGMLFGGLIFFWFRGFTLTFESKKYIYGMSVDATLARDFFKEAVETLSYPGPHLIWHDD